MTWSRIIGLVGSGFVVRVAAAIGAIVLAHAAVTEINSTFNRASAVLNQVNTGAQR